MASPDEKRTRSRHAGARNVASWMGVLAWFALVGGIVLGVLLGLATRSGPGWVIAFMIMAFSITTALAFFGFRHVIALLIEIAERD